MFLDLIKKRRSIRKFLDKTIEKEKIDILIEAGLRSPSSKSTNPWHFIVIHNKDVLVKLSKAKPHGSSFLKNAPLGILVCADSSVSDVWIEDASIASVFIHLAACDIGLGSCWIQFRGRKHNDQISCDRYIKAVLNIQDNLEVEALIAVGYPDEQKKGHQKESLLVDRIRHIK